MIDAIFTVTSVNFNLNNKTDSCYNCRCVGWFKTFTDAEDIVISNTLNIYENGYNYSVIEKVNPGLYSLQREETWFRYVNGYYLLVDKPKELRNVVNFGMG